MKTRKIVRLLLCLTLFLTGCGKVSRAVSAEPLRLTYLVAGCDEAAENTDVLFLLTYDGVAHTADICQIPRDTYVKDGAYQHKINQLYAAARQSGASSHEAMQALCETVSSLFGVAPNGYISVTLPAFRAAVDALGGVDMTSDYPLTFTVGGQTVRLREGENHLNGAQAEAFVRYRSGYLTGDLGRMDAQKRFMAALLQTVRQAPKTGLLAAFSAARSGISTNQSIADLLELTLKLLPTLKDTRFSFVTLPGEAVRADNGLWYYIINREGAQELLAGHFGVSVAAFDTEQRLTNPQIPAFDAIYHAPSASYRVYDEDALR